MTVQDKLLYFWAQEVGKNIVNQTIEFLKKQKNLTSGDDTCLENNWEEYCMQVQYEESIAWDAYMAHIEALFERYFSELSKAEQLTLWLESEDGRDWYYDNEKNDDFKYEQAPVWFEDCVKDLMSKLNEMAINYESENITNYIDSLE